MEENQRNCPECNKVLTYTSKENCSAAKRANRICRECNGKHHSKRISGENNYWYGKSLPQEVKDKLSKTKLSLDYSHLRTPEYRDFQRQIQSGANNKMFGRTPHDVWVEKYGKEEADRRFESWKANVTKNAPRGEENHQFGKPPPNNSGNGWKGHYKEKFFRSLRELCFILELESKNLVWTSAEKIRIKYEFEGKIKTYAPDFLVGNILYEIKPQRLIDTSKLVKIKAEAGEQYCKENDLIYILTDVEIKSYLILEQLELGNIKFQGDYEEKFRNYIAQKINKREKKI